MLRSFKILLKSRLVYDSLNNEQGSNFQSHDSEIKKFQGRPHVSEKIEKWRQLLTPAPATIVVTKPLINHNSWTDRDREPVKTFLDARDSNESNENDKTYLVVIFFIWSLA